MAVTKIIKDQIIRLLNGPKSVPRGLLEWYDYSKNYGGINFEFKRENGQIVAVSRDFHFGSIITSADNEQELDQKIKDAILTSFEIPSSYATEAKIFRTGKESAEYVLA